MTRVVWCVIPLICLGCAASTPPISEVPPVPSSEQGWSTPSIVPDDPPLVDRFPVESDRPASAAEKVYAYQEGKVYVLTVGVNHPLDIQLAPGETIDNQLAGTSVLLPKDDETPPWDIREAKSGTPMRPHLFINATKPDLRMGWVVTTSERTYHFEVISVLTSKTRVVRWTYPSPTRLSLPAEAPALLPDPSRPATYYGGYTICPADDCDPSTPRPLWTPRQVLNQYVGSQIKTYIVFPPQLSSMAAPMIRLLGVDGPELMNAKLLGSVMVVNHLSEHGFELRLGAGPHAETVIIRRQAPVEIRCPGSPACPTWPVMRAMAAGGLSR